MNRFLKIPTLLIAAALLTAFLSGCQNSTGKTDTAASSSSSSSQAAKTAGTATHTGLSLPVMLSKSLNPLTTDSFINFNLWPLMYDSLTVPDQSYNPVNQLASSISNSGTTVTVQLKSASFSDGSALTARDVKYSFSMVMGDTASYFYSNTANITDIGTRGNQTVVFTLKTPDPLFVNLLDIPIIKYGTDQNNASYSQTGINVPPVGSGRYVFSTDSYSGTLSANKKWYGGVNLSFGQISLVNILNSDSSFSNLKIGGVNYLFTDYGNGLKSAVGISMANVNLNRLIYMGVNSHRPGLSDTAVRSCLSLPIDRKSIVSNVFSSKAAGTYLPFNPDWSQVSRPADAKLSPSYDAAQSLLSENGFTVTDSNGALMGSIGGQTVTLSYNLLVDQNDALLLSAAREISDDLKKVGIKINIDAEASDAYNSALSSGNFDLYLGQITLSDDMDLSPLLAPGAAASYGVPDANQTFAAFNAWRAGTGRPEDVVNAFSKETPFVPICYRYGLVSYTKGLNGVSTSNYYDIFANVENWHF